MYKVSVLKFRYRLGLEKVLELKDLYLSNVAGNEEGGRRGGGGDHKGRRLLLSWVHEDLWTRTRN